MAMENLQDLTEEAGKLVALILEVFDLLEYSEEPSDQEIDALLEFFLGVLGDDREGV